MTLPSDDEDEDKKKRPITPPPHTDTPASSTRHGMTGMLSEDDDDDDIDDYDDNNSVMTTPVSESATLGASFRALYQNPQDPSMSPAPPELPLVPPPTAPSPVSMAERLLENYDTQSSLADSSLSESSISSSLINDLDDHHFDDEDTMDSINSCNGSGFLSASSNGSVSEDASDAATASLLDDDSTLTSVSSLPSIGRKSKKMAFHDSVGSLGSMSMSFVSSDDDFLRGEQRVHMSIRAYGKNKKTFRREKKETGDPPITTNADRFCTLVWDCCVYTGVFCCVLLWDSR
eukprot:CAMPEP_0113623230 /NCGR_PEP_ID=MMETSP0017_2-20120614/11943_1 /TAXON_ID=2856 /ORGANISM="Cylindrotheca closterium" /LENGTH=288 /DNA_ID=CAMNT_0000533159 /DNA_START=188 /DNA_END=1054 /DNA_ORIENTATION=+ /assembly_acc=CAM_ASM_000147